MDDNRRRKPKRKLVEFSTLRQLKLWLRDSVAGQSVLRELTNEQIKATRKTPLVLAVEHCDHVGIYADRRIDLRRHTMTRTNTLEAELVAEQLLELDLTKPELDLYLPGVDVTGAGFVGIVQHKDIDAEQLEANEWASQVMRILTEIGSEQ